MEVQFIEHIRHSLLIDRNKDLVIEKLLNLTLEIISLLTREDFVVVRKSGDHVTDGSIAPGSDRWRSSSVTEAPPHSPTEERFLGAAPIYHGESEEVPEKTQDVAEWDYPEEHKDVVMVPPQPCGSVGECSNTHRSARCETPLYSQDCIKEETRVMTPDYQIPPQCEEEDTITDPVGSGEFGSRNLSESCETPRYSPDRIEEDTIRIPLQADHEVTMFPLQCKEEAFPAPISSGPPISSHYPETIHQCSECHKCFQDYPDLVAHQQTHSANHPFSCSVCGVCFPSELILIAHQQIHSGKKSLQCSQCGKSFSRKSRLLSHKRTHTGEKPFSCPECGRCFAERSALVTHKRIHSGEKPFMCSVCGKRFVQGSSLVKHQRIHTGERPFACFHCGRSFSDSSNLVRHQRIHSREKPFMFSVQKH